MNRGHQSRPCPLLPDTANIPAIFVPRLIPPANEAAALGLAACAGAFLAVAAGESRGGGLPLGLAVLLAAAALATLIYGRPEKRPQAPAESPDKGGAPNAVAPQAVEEDRLLPPLLSGAGSLLNAEAGILMQAGPSTQRILAVWNWRGLAADAIFPLPPGPLTFALETAQPYASTAPGENRLGFTGKLAGNFLLLPFDWHGGRFLLFLKRGLAFRRWKEP